MYAGRQKLKYRGHSDFTVGDCLIARQQTHKVRDYLTHYVFALRRPSTPRGPYALPCPETVNGTYTFGMQARGYFSRVLMKSTLGMLRKTFGRPSVEGNLVSQQ